MTTTDANLSPTRRRFLRGLGLAVALPAMESLLPRGLALAASPAARLATSPAGTPLRMAFFYIPNGVHQKNWFPTGEGADFQLNKTMEPLEALKHRVHVISGLDHLNATAGKDGPGDHARASSTFLTGVRVKKTSGSDIHAGVSIDQLAARHVGHLTRFPSLELTCDGVRKSGGCDSGYSCAYDYNMSWRSPTTPMTPEANPRLVFERLFGAGAPSDRRRRTSPAARPSRSRSSTSSSTTPATLRGQLAARDGQKLDEYLAGVREIEARIQQAEKLGDGPAARRRHPARASPPPTATTSASSAT